MLCLNMIVKNEEHIVRETLESIYKYIDYYVISDTGSTDNTKLVIKEFFDGKGIKGEIYDDHWVNFGHNRSIALKRAKGKCQYTWVIDADDLVVGEFNFPNNPTSDSYVLQFGEYNRYFRQQIFASKLDWYYVGALHEYPCCDKINHDKTVLTGNYYIDSRRLGNRNLDDQKYQKDAMVFEKELSRDPFNARNMFYLAQSYLSFNDYENAIRCYKKRITMGDFYEEIYQSYYHIADIFNKTEHENSEKIIKAYMEAYNYYPYRQEPLYNIVVIEIGDKNYENAYICSSRSINIPFPKNDRLFIWTGVYECLTLLKHAELCYNSGRYDNACKSFNKLLKQNKCSHQLINYAQEMLLKCSHLLNNSNRKETIVFYVAYYDKRIIKYLRDLVDNIGKYYDIYFTGSWNDFMPSDVSYVDYDTLNSLPLMVNYLFLINSISCSIFCEKKYIVLFDDMFQDILPNNTIVFMNNIDIITKLNIDAILFYDDSIKKSFTHNYKYDGMTYMVSDQMFLECLEDVSYGITVMKKVTIIKAFNTSKMLLPASLKSDSHFYNSVVENIYNNVYEKYPINDFLVELLTFYKLNYDNVDYQNLVDLKLINIDMESLTIDDIDLIMILAETMYSKKQYICSFQLCDKFTNPFINQFNTTNYYKHDQLINIRDKNIDNFKDIYIRYPKNIVINLDNNKDNKTIYYEKIIMLSMTTCKRLDLFEKTVNSFLNCCIDVLSIKYFLCVDDNSSVEDRKRMQELYPFFEFIWKNEYEKGHYKSMNIILDKVIEYNVDYVIHLEDDFHFIKPMNYVSESLKILLIDNQYGQVVFNRNYSEVPFYERKLDGGYVKFHKNIRYIEHEHYKPDTVKYNHFIKQNGLTVAYWPHYTFQPSMLKGDMLRAIGHYYYSHQFEREYAKEYCERGYITCFYDDFTRIHIGRKSWEQGDNAYKLNNMEQFKMEDKQISIYVISYNIDSWKLFKEKYYNIFPNMQRVVIEDRVLCDMSYDTVNEFIKQDCSLHHFIWNITNSKYTLVLYDSCVIDDYDQLLDLLDDNRKVIIGENGYILHKDFVNEIKHQTTIYNENICNWLRLYDHIKTNLIACNASIDDIYKTIEFVYYPMYDSISYDIKYCHNITNANMKNICKNNIKARGYNTFGYFKYLITLDNLTRVGQKGDGLYVCSKEVKLFGNNMKTIQKNMELHQDLTIIIFYSNFNYTIECLSNLLFYVNDLYLVKDIICTKPYTDNVCDLVDYERISEKYEFIKLVDVKGNYGQQLNQLFFSGIIDTKHVLFLKDNWRCASDISLKKLYSDSQQIDQLVLVNKSIDLNDSEYTAHIYNPYHNKKTSEQRNYDILMGIKTENVLNIGANTNSPWPGFYFNPSIFSMGILEKNGRFMEDDVYQNMVEYDYALRTFQNNINVYLTTNDIVNISG